MNGGKKAMSKNYKLKLLFNLSVAIAVVFAVCFYNNQTGIACAVFGIFIVSMFWRLIRKKKNGRMGFWNIAYGLCCILLSLIPMITDNLFISFSGKMLFIVILIKWTIHIYYNVDKIEFVRNISMIFDFVFAAISQLFSPFTDIKRVAKKEDLKTFDRETEEDGTGKPEEKQSYKKQIFIGIVVSIPVLVVVLYLLASADVVFRNILLSVFKGADNIVVLIKWLLTSFIGFLAAYGCGRALIQNKIKINDVEVRKADTVVGITFAGIFSAVYILFCGIQIAALLNTKGNMLPEGYTYAKYARTGFFQLLIVCIINVCMVIACRFKFNINGILKKLLTVISACTYIMIASSAVRMILYIRNYNLTFLRMLVLWALMVIAVLMIFVIWFIYNPEIKLFEYALISVTVFFLLFAFIRPDNIIAGYNIRNYKDDEHWDVYYLTKNLSMDAAEMIVSGEEVIDNPYEMGIYCENIVSEYEDKYKHDIRKFNYSRYQAYKKAKSYLKTHDSYKKIKKEY